MFTIHQLQPTFLAIVLAAACCEVRAEQNTPGERFFVAASEWVLFLDPKVKAYRERSEDCVLLFDALGATYDAVLTTESGRFRDSLIDNYHRNLPIAIAEKANLETATGAIMRDLDQGYNFLHQKGYDEFKRQSVYQELDELIQKGREAIGKFKQLPRLGSLPDPIPDTVEPAEVLGVSYPSLEMKQDTWYPAEVRVKNNAHYTPRDVEVEIRVRSGPAKIKGSVLKKVTVPPGATRILTWEFMATGDGEFDIGARVVPPKS